MKKWLLRTHHAIWFKKCRNCEHWTGEGMMADDDEICEISKDYCPYFYTLPTSEGIHGEYGKIVEVDK